MEELCQEYDTPPLLRKLGAYSGFVELFNKGTISNTTFNEQLELIKDNFDLVMLFSLIIARTTIVFSFLQVEPLSSPDDQQSELPVYLCLHHSID